MLLSDEATNSQLNRPLRNAIKHVEQIEDVRRASRLTPEELTNRTIYRRAVDAVVWGLPLVGEDTVKQPTSAMARRITTISSGGPPKRRHKWNVHYVPLTDSCPHLSPRFRYKNVPIQTRYVAQARARRGQIPAYQLKPRSLQ